MRRYLLAALIAVGIATPAHGQFSFRTTGEQAFRIFTVRPTPSSLGVPPLSDSNHVKFWVPDTGHPGYSAGSIYLSQNGGPWTLLSSFVGSGAVASVFGRFGSVVAVQADYDPFFLTQSEGDARYLELTDTNVTTFNTRSGAVTPQQADYDGFFLTSTEGNSAYAETATGNTFTGNQTVIGKLGVSAAPFAQFGNDSANFTDSLGTGLNSSTSMIWTTPIGGGYVAGFKNADAGAARHGILLNIAASDAGSRAFRIESGAAAGRFTIDGAGNVLIGPGATSAFRFSVENLFAYDGTNVLIGRAPGITGSNYERVRTFIDASNASIISEFAGTGVRRPLKLSTQGATSLTLDATIAQFSAGASTFARATADGVWTAFTPTLGASAGTFSCTTTTAAKYMLVGKTLRITAILSGCSVSATPTNLTITIPGGFSASATDGQVLAMSDNGTAGTGWARINSTTISLYKNIAQSGTWATAAGTTAIGFQADVQIP